MKEVRYPCIGEKCKAYSRLDDTEICRTNNSTTFTKPGQPCIDPMHAYGDTLQVRAYLASKSEDLT